MPEFLNPVIATSYLQVNGSGAPFLRMASGGNTGQFSWSPTANRTLTLPDTSGTVLLRPASPAANAIPLMDSAGVLFTSGFKIEPFTGFYGASYDVISDRSTVQLRASDSGALTVVLLNAEVYASYLNASVAELNDGTQQIYLTPNEPRMRTVSGLTLSSTDAAAIALRRNTATGNNVATVASLTRSTPPGGSVAGAAGIGGRVEYRLGTATLSASEPVQVEAGRLEYSLPTNTSSTNFRGRLSWSVADNAAMREAIRADASGSAVSGSLFGDWVASSSLATPSLIMQSGGFTATLSAALTANRVISIPNGSGTLAFTNSALNPSTFIVPAAAFSTNGQLRVNGSNQLEYRVSPTVTHTLLDDSSIGSQVQAFSARLAAIEDAFAAASDGQVPTKSGGTLVYSTPSGGGGGGAPTTASYLVLATNVGLDNERAIAFGDGISGTDGGAGGNYTLNLHSRLATAATAIASNSTFFGRNSTGDFGYFAAPSGGSSEIRYTFSDANYTIPSDATVVAQTGVMTAHRTVTLPAASGVAAGAVIEIRQEGQSYGGILEVRIAANGTDTIAGLPVGGVAAIGFGETAIKVIRNSSSAASEWRTAVLAVDSGADAGFLLNIPAFAAGGNVAFSPAPALGTNNVGGGSGTTLGSASAPWLALVTGTTATGRGGLRTASGLFQLGNGETIMKCRAGAASILSDASQTYQLIAGFNVNPSSNALANLVDAVIWVYSHGINSGRWQAICRSGSVDTVIDSTVTLAVNTLYELGIWVNAAGTEVRFFIDGVQIGSPVTTNIPTGSGKRMAAEVTNRKTVSTVSRSAIVGSFQVRSMGFVK